MKLYKALQSPAVVQAVSHPLRARMLSVLQEQEASPKELATHFGVPLSNVAYHIQVLRKLKLIRLVKKTPRRGAIEHHYKADRATQIEDDAWSQIPGVIKERMVAATLEDIGALATEAAATGGFNHSNAHLTRTSVVLDEEAWDTLSARMMDLLEGIDALEAESAKRLRQSNHAGERQTGIAMMLFESMPGVLNADEARPQDPAIGHAEGRSPAARGR